MPPPPWSYPQALSANPPIGSGYGGSSAYIPPRAHDNFYPADYPLMEKQPHHGISMYGQNGPPIGMHSSANQQAPPVISQVSSNHQVCSG